ncbi:MAG: hypothetical protein ACK5GB_00065 [Sphingomonadales bacterium]
MLYAIGFLFAYGVLPLVFGWVTGLLTDHAFTLSYICFFSVLFVSAGMFLHFKVSFKRVRLLLDFTSVSIFIFAVFIFFIVVCMITAERIPIVASLQGEDAATLAYLREMFLKGRTGWQGSFVYINALLGGSIIPYIICVAFERKSNLRFVYLFIFFLYSISFLEKGFFMKIAIPLFFLFFSTVKNKFSFFVTAMSIMFGLLVVMSVASKGPGSQVVDSDDSFFSAYYTARGPVSQLTWRAFVIPVVTSIDAIRLFVENYGGSLLMGATNSTLALLFNRPRVEFEREVYGFQWGQNEAGTGSANSVYLTEAYVNFGMFGVAIFSLLVGRILYIFMSSRDISIRAISILFLYSIYNSGLLSTLLSNGFLVMLLIAFFVKWKN